MVTAHSGLLQFPQMLFRQSSQRGAHPTAHVFGQVAHHSQQTMQFLLFQSAPAGHDADTAHGPGSQPQDAFTQLTGLQKRKVGDGRVVMAALGTKAAVHAAIAAAGIDDGAQADVLAVMALAQDGSTVQQGFQRRIKKMSRLSGRGGDGKNRMVHAMDPWGECLGQRGQTSGQCLSGWMRSAMPPEGHMALHQGSICPSGKRKNPPGGGCLCYWALRRFSHSFMSFILRRRSRCSALHTRGVSFLKPHFSR